MRKYRLIKAVSLLAATLGMQLSTTPVFAQTATVTVDPTAVNQVIRGFGGFSGAGWIPELTAAQIDTAFGTGAGQVGLSIMRMRIDPDSTKWQTQVTSAQLATAKGVSLFASPWSPPAYMKDNNNLVHGSLLPAYYPDYATHLLNFASFMQSNGAPLYGISVQNEPDYDPSYEGCTWTSDQMISFISSQGSRFAGITKLMAPESYNFSKTFTDPILNNATAASQISIVNGHLYGVSPSDYPLARSLGKDVWMTEHYVNSSADANDWTNALPLAIELHKSMVANYNSYIWWYIRRSYGLITEDGNISKRGLIMSQYAKYVRPGYTRIAATEKPYTDVYVTAYKSSTGAVTVVGVNNGSRTRQINITFGSGAPTSLLKYSTSSTVNNAYGGQYTVTSGTASVVLEPSSVATFVSP